MKDTLDLPFEDLIAMIEVASNQKRDRNVKHVTADEYIKMFGIGGLDYGVAD